MYLANCIINQKLHQERIPLKRVTSTIESGSSLRRLVKLVHELWQIPYNILITVRSCSCVPFLATIFTLVKYIVLFSGFFILVAKNCRFISSPALMQEIIHEEEGIPVWAAQTHTAATMCSSTHSAYPLDRNIIIRELDIYRLFGIKSG